MADFTSVFERREKKYLLSPQQHSLLIGIIKEHMRADEHGESDVVSIYFDTPDSWLIGRSLERPKYKEKLRLRSYGVPHSGDTVFMELKKKYKGVVYKRRTDLTFEEAEALLGGHPPSPRTQIGREIDYSFKRYAALRPAMLIACRRSAWFDKSDPNLRVTFDHDILWRNTDVGYSGGIYGEALLPEGQVLMEIKAAGALPLWLVSVLSAARIYPTSFSKYGTAYKHTLLNSEVYANVQ